MTRCKQCNKETRVICICGLCPSCNGTEERINELYDLGHKIGELANKGLPYEKEEKKWKGLYAKTKKMEKKK